ncbi:MAG: hypothetical protein NTV22_05175 [bacterium]|nr:hypothetical protein [bacterium]
MNLRLLAITSGTGVPAQLACVRTARLLAILVVATLAAAPRAATAVVITPTNAIATSANKPDPNPYSAPWNVWNGSALTKSGGDAGILTWTHATDAYGFGMWQANYQPLASITLVLGGAVNLNKIYLWNGTQTGGEGWSRKIKTVDVSTSADGVTFSTPTNLTLTSANTNVIEGTQEFPLVANNVTQIKLHVTSVNGGDTVMLGEVRFDGTIPEPALIGVLGAVAVAFVRRRA